MAHLPETSQMSASAGRNELQRTPQLRGAEKTFKFMQTTQPYRTSGVAAETRCAYAPSLVQRNLSA